MEPEDINMEYIYHYTYYSPKLKDYIYYNQIPFSKPSDMNDPFDSKILVKNKGTREEWIIFLKKQGKTQDEIDYIMEHYSIQNMNSRGTIAKNNFDTMRIACFSKINDSILMWSHYSKGHNGVCLIFKVEEYGNAKCLRFTNESINFNGNSYLPILPINYSPNRPETYNLLNDDEEYKNNEAKKALLNKSSLWCYEVERRIWCPSESLIKYPDKDKADYSIGTLNGIIFGVCTNKNICGNIYEIIKEKYLDNNLPFKFFFAKESYSQYEVEILPIDNINRFLMNR
jgi:hypothetical protein